MLMKVLKLGQHLLAEGDPCPDLVPGTFDWHTLRPEDPFPNGQYGERVYWYFLTYCLVCLKFGSRQISAGADVRCH